MLSRLNDYVRRRPWVVGVVPLALMILEIGACQVFDAVVHTRDSNRVVRGEFRSSDGRNISYIRQQVPASDAPLLVYVHGTPGDANAFSDYIANPLKGFESYSIDRPGFGRTKPRKPVLTLSEQADCILPLLVERGGRWPILVGHSLGAPIVVQAALDYPERVGGIVILSGSLDPSLERVGWYQRTADFGPFKYMIPRFVRNSNRELMPMKNELERLAERLSQLRVPVIILHAPDDILVPFENVDFMQRSFPNGTVIDSIVLDGKNHFIPWNAAAEVREAILRLEHDIADESEGSK